MPTEAETAATRPPPRTAEDGRGRPRTAGSAQSRESEGASPQSQEPRGPTDTTLGLHTQAVRECTSVVLSHRAAVFVGAAQEASAQLTPARPELPSCRGQRRRRCGGNGHDSHPAVRPPG